MRIIGPPHYKPEVTCLDPKTAALTREYLRKRRLADERRDLLRKARRKREAALMCPDCGDTLKVRYQGRWVCHHCLGVMVLPGEDRLWTWVP